MTDSNNLSKLREEISAIDAQILELLAERKKHSLEVVSTKEQTGIELRDTGREEEVVLQALQKSKDLGLDKHYIHSIFNEILADSNRIQRKYLQDKINEDTDSKSVSIAFQQVNGKYAAEAASKHFTDYELICNAVDTIKDAVEQAESGKSDYVVLAIENNTAGANNEVYDLLLHAQLHITGEAKVQFEPCLIGIQGSGVKHVKDVYCHPQDALLCRNFISDHGLKIKYLADYESAVDKVRELKSKEAAAITGKLIEDIDGLAVLREGIGNQKEIFSRFIIAARKPVKVDLRVPAKTSIVFSIHQEAGALAAVLNVFKEFEINLTKLESRPVQGNNWEEMFYVDFQGNIADERVKMALDQVGRQCKFVKVLGCYPVLDVEAISINTSALAEKKSETVEKAPKEVKPAKKSGLTSSRDYKAEDTVIDVKGVKIGGSDFVIMSGPCSVESYDQIMDCARHAKETGSQILRGGCFKPRTSPYSFQGLGYEGLDMLVNAGKQYGMPVITEVLSNEDVQKVAEKTDIIQVGARNMQNFTLLSEIGRTQRPVLLKRGMSSSISDLLNAAEYILAGGNLQVMFCERGIRTFETATRFTLDLSLVPVLKSKSHLPVIIDPSHAAGERDLVIPLAVAAKAVGADGIIVEFHPEPEKALSDGPQALLFPQVEEMMQKLSEVPKYRYS